MIHVDIYTESITRDGQAVENYAAAFTVNGADLVFTHGDALHVNLGLPVFSEEHGRLITFDDDPEAWARLLPTAYRNGAIRAEVTEIAASGGQSVSDQVVPEPALHLIS